MTSKQRFWSKVNKRGPRQPHMKTRCWNWIASFFKDGYGQFWFEGTNHMAHRWAYENLGKKRKLNKLCCLHKCDNPSCVRPSHLFRGTKQDNMTDKVSKHRQSRGQTNGFSKLKEIQVTKIRKLYATGRYTQRQLGERFGVVNQLISTIVNRQRWKHI